MRHGLVRAIPPVLAAVLAAAAFAGCGSGGRRGGQVVPTTCMTFQGTSPPTASKVVTRQGSGSQCEMLQVELVLTDVMDVLTVEFTVDFDAAVAEYEGLSETGSVLTSDGANLNVLVNENPGQVTLALSRFTTGIDFNGAGTVIRLIFSPATNAVAGASALSFSSTQIFGSETPPQEKAGIQWIGGNFQVTDN